MKNVLLLGDSIRMGYEPYVRQELNGTAAVYAPEENCRFSAYTLNSLRFWLPEFPVPNVIHWNNGAWDYAQIFGFYQPEFTPKNEYIRNMLLIARELKKTGAKIIFATSLPCRPDFPRAKIEKIIEYNAAIVPELKKQGIEINDLYSAVYPRFMDLIGQDGLHLTDEGYAFCGRIVAEKIKSCLEKHS